MKVAILFALVGAAFAVPTAQDNIDWSKISSINLYLEPQAELVDPRVIGGSEAPKHSRPFQAGLIIDGSGFCGGSLISKNYVLTAAHCAKGARSIQVILGAHNVQTSESTQVRLTSTNLIVNSGYSSNTLANDIALIKLPSAVTLNSNIATVQLAPASAGDYSGQTAVLSGWGKTSDSGSISSVLMQVNLSVLTNNACASVFGSSIITSMICTSGSGKKGGCNGDSGGPLTVNGVQTGIVSFGSSQCTAGNPTVFTRVSKFRTWIAQNSDVSASA